MALRNDDRNRVQRHLRAAGREDFTACGKPAAAVAGRIVHDLGGFPSDEQCGSCRRSTGKPQRRNVHELVGEAFDGRRALCGTPVLATTLLGAGADVTCGNCKRRRALRSARQ